MKKFVLPMLSLVMFCLYPSVQAKPNLSNMVEPVNYFVNHKKQVDEIKKKLHLYRKVSLQGVSGIGKTQLARKYAYLNQNDYDLIWFFDANLDINEQFVQLAKYINASGQIKRQKLSEDYKKSRKEVKDYLSPKDRWLLVFDDLKLDNNSKVQDMIDWAHNGHVMICSQDLDQLPHPITVPYLSAEESSILVDGFDSKINPKAKEKIIKLSEGYPILLAQGSLFLKENKHMSVDEYNRLVNNKNKMKSHVLTVLKSLSPSSKLLLNKAIMLNNQGFSKELLKNMVSDKDKFSDDLHELVRYGLVSSMTSVSNQKTVLEIHDRVKDIVVNDLSAGDAKTAIEESIKLLNGSLSQSRIAKHLSLESDNTLLSNLEALLKNAERYDLSLFTNLELRKNLSSFYLDNSDYRKFSQLVEWFESNKENFGFFFASDTEKVSYSEYILSLGLYEFWVKSNLETGLAYLNEAADIIEKLKDYPEIKFRIYLNLSQMHTSNANLAQAKDNLKKAAKMEYKISDLEFVRYWGASAKILLSEGKHKESLGHQLKKVTMFNEKLPQGIMTAPTYLRQAEILNYMGNYEEAEKIAERIYEQGKPQTLIGDRGYQDNIEANVQLARAKLGLKRKNEALNIVNEAKSLYLKDQNNSYDKFDHIAMMNSKDEDLASLLVTEGDVMAAFNKTDEALISYFTAESIYLNRYGQNMKLMDNISYLYFQEADYVCKIPKLNQKCVELVEKHIKKFKPTHPRSQILLKEYVGKK